MQTFSLSQLAVLFVDGAVKANLVLAEDRAYTINRLLDTLQCDAPEMAEGDFALLDLAERMTALAAEKGLINDSLEEKERFSARLFGVITAEPAAIRQRFDRLARDLSIEDATSWFYALCKQNDYIRTRHIAQNMLFYADSPVGQLEITINLSKPEKDPRDIAAALKAKSVSYPKCMLCIENPGYAGRPGYPARQNHRMIPLELQKETWYFQYSPYLYYDEHCIILNKEHVPMFLTRASFERMLDFVDRFPHYMIGANADLPIVGGSILTHDHYQGGRHVFPMEKAPVRVSVTMPDGRIALDILEWPITCLKLTSQDRYLIAEWGDTLLAAWRRHTDKGLNIYADSGEQNHNTITPVLRKNGASYTLYLMLRNNLTTPDHPMGLYHPHEDKHHIKKENIGLIEAMGLFILPGRLKQEMAEVQSFLLDEGTLPHDSPHFTWAQALKRQHPSLRDAGEAEAVVQKAVGDVCYGVLCDAGVYKRTGEGMAGISRFLKAAGIQKEGGQG